MTNIALLGAGGKMGVRLATNLKGSRFTVDHVEVSEEGRARLAAATGYGCVDQDTDVITMTGSIRAGSEIYALGAEPEPAAAEARARAVWESRARGRLA